MSKTPSKADPATDHRQLGFVEQLNEHLWATIGIVVCLAAYVLVKAMHFVPEEYATIVSELFLTLCVVLIVHVLDHMYLSRGTTKLVIDTKKEIEESIRPVSADAHAALQGLADASLSFAAMRATGITRIYGNRGLAGQDIAEELTQDNVNEIRLIGISLNDFVMDSRSKLFIAFERIKQVLNGTNADGEAKPDRALIVKVLIVDPYSYGARQRYKCELQDDNAPLSRLQHDVEIVAKRLHSLKGKVPQINTHANGARSVSFDCRVYRTAPQLFLAWTNNCCFTQQYFYWSSRAVESAVPAIRFQPLDSGPDPSERAFEPIRMDMHRELGKHFDWVWEHASISLEEFCEQHVLGCDMGLSQADAVSVYMDPVQSKKRIISLLEEVKDNSQVDLLGISLHSFFDMRLEIAQALAEKVLKKRGVKVRVLCIDPDGEQAKTRSYREMRLSDVPEDIKKADFDEYRNNKEVGEESDLRRDTASTLKKLGNHVQSSKVADWFRNADPILADAAVKCGGESAGQWKPAHEELCRSLEKLNDDCDGAAKLVVQSIRSCKSAEQLKTAVNNVRKMEEAQWCSFQAWKYQSAPSCFMLRVDNRALFEPYTYGKVDVSGGKRILGGDMPLFEFDSPTERKFDLFDRIEHRNPVKLLEDHFNFVVAVSDPIKASDNSAAVIHGSEEPPGIQVK